MKLKATIVLEVGNFWEKEVKEMNNIQESK